MPIRTIAEPVGGLSKFAIFWFILSAAIVIIDASFVVMRPASMNATTLPHSLWVTYSKHDKRYASMEDAFVVVQSYLNFFEVGLQLLAVLLSLLSVSGLANKIGLVVSVMTIYKTVIYGLMEHFENDKYTKHNSQVDLWQMVIIPSAFWVVIPGFIAIQCWRNLDLGVTYQTFAAGKDGKEKRLKD